MVTDLKVWGFGGGMAFLNAVKCKKIIPVPLGVRRSAVSTWVSPGCCIKGRREANERRKLGTSRHQDPNTALLLP